MMHILLVSNRIIPVKLYGGTERVIWYLGKQLVRLGHRVTYLVKPGSYCEFAPVITYNHESDIMKLIPADTDLVHYHFYPFNMNKTQKPYLVTVHGNTNEQNDLDINSVFLSQNHANRFGSPSYVYNGLDWDDYSKPNLRSDQTYFHFLGKAAWKIKNVQGAIDVIKATRDEKLNVLGGVRFNFNMGWRFTYSPRIRFHGMIGGPAKDHLLIHSRGLITPVLWHEPFGLSMIESLYFGCPIFGTPYGSLPEIVGPDQGYLSTNKMDLVQAIHCAGDFSRARCHEYALEQFNSKKMAIGYLEKYALVLANQKLNPKPPRLKEVQLEKFLPWG